MSLQNHRLVVSNGQLLFKHIFESYITVLLFPQIPDCLRLLILIHCRYYIFRDYIDDIERKEPGGMDGFTKAYETFGIHVKPDGSVVWHEWCPGAKDLRAYGDFSKCVWYMLGAVSQNCSFLLVVVPSVKS